jgi:hypothetical protein
MARSDQTPAGDKEAKLAQALRANLRRRKAAPPPQPESPPKAEKPGEAG